VKFVEALHFFWCKKESVIKLTRFIVVHLAFLVYQVKDRFAHALRFFLYYIDPGNFQVSFEKFRVLLLCCCIVVGVNMSLEAGQMFSWSALFRRSFILTVHATLSPPNFYSTISTEGVVPYSVQY
jgi:hypothetical protein